MSFESPFLFGKLTKVERKHISNEFLNVAHFFSSRGEVQPELTVKYQHHHGDLPTPPVTVLHIFVTGQKTNAFLDKTRKKNHEAF